MTMEDYGDSSSSSSMSLPGIVVNVINTGCVSNCSGNGNCINNHCACNTPYAESDCSITFPDALGYWYYIYTISFGSCFVLVSLWAIYKTYHMLRFAGKKAALKVLPVIYYMIALDGLVNGTELLVDDQGWKGRLGRTAAFVLYGVGIWLLLAIFLMMILLWVECYYKMTKKSGFMARHLRRIFGVVLVITFVIEIVFRVMWSPRLEAPMVISYYTYLLVFTTSLSVGFLVYGIKLYKRVQQINTPYNKTKEERLKKIHRLSIGSAIIIISGMIIVVVTGLMEELVFGPYDPTYFVVQQSLFHTFEISFLAHVTSTLYSPQNKEVEMLKGRKQQAREETGRLINDSHHIQLS